MADANLPVTDAAEKAYAAAAEATAGPKSAEPAIALPKLKGKPVPQPKSAPGAKPTATPKETIMAKTTDFAADFTGKLQDAFVQAQDKAQTVAKDVYAKGSAAASEAGTFAKGNVEAAVESGKILAEGVKDIGADYVAEGKKAFEVMTADVKKFAAAKSPTEFFALQSEVLRRNLDSLVAFGTKNGEATAKLAGEAFAPISARFTAALDKVSKAA